MSSGALDAALASIRSSSSRRCSAACRCGRPRAQVGVQLQQAGEALPGDEESALDIPPDARPDEYLDAKPAWQKIAITLAGPAMNLALPVVLLTGMLWVGMPKPNNVIGLVERGSPAAEAGLEPGDRIVAIDGAPIQWWRQVQRRGRDAAPGQEADWKWTV